MTSSHHDPGPCQWSSHLAAALPTDAHPAVPRGGPPRGRRTATSRAADGIAEGRETQPLGDHAVAGTRPDLVAENPGHGLTSGRLGLARIPHKRGFPWTETPSQFKGDRLRFLAGFEDNPRSRVRGFLGGNASRDLFFRLNIPPNVQEAAQLHSQFFLTPTAREGTTLALSAAINAIGDRHPRRNPLTSRSPGRGRLLLPPLLPGARRHPPPTL